MYVVVYFHKDRSGEMAVLPLGAAVTLFTNPALLHTLRYLTATTRGGNGDRVCPSKRHLTTGSR